MICFKCSSPWHVTDSCPVPVDPRDAQIASLTARAQAAEGERDEALRARDDLLSEQHDFVQESIRLHKYEQETDAEVRATLEEIDMIVPDSDPAYENGNESTTLLARRDTYVRLMYEAAGHVATLNRRLVAAEHVIVLARNAVRGAYDSRDKLCWDESDHASLAAAIKTYDGPVK